MYVSLTGKGFRGEHYDFKVELISVSLDHLLDDARQAYRIYELFAIKRPGDVRKYHFVRPLDLPQRIQESCNHAREKATNRWGPHPWPEGLIPLPDFDKLFFWTWDDTEREVEIWLDFRESKRFINYLTVEFEKIVALQSVLRNGSDAIIRHEIMLLEERRHQLDFEAETPLNRTDNGYRSITIPTNTESYYSTLRRLLHRSDINSVASRGDKDYQAVHLMCAEQRIRAEAKSKSPLVAFTISLLSDGLEYTHHWKAQIWFFSEGLGYGDLLIDDRKDNWIKGHPWVLSSVDKGENESYHREAGDGWFLYTANQELSEKLRGHGANYLKMRNEGHAIEE